MKLRNITEKAFDPKIASPKFLVATLTSLATDLHTTFKKFVPHTQFYMRVETTAAGLTIVYGQDSSEYPRRFEMEIPFPLTDSSLLLSRQTAPYKWEHASKVDVMSDFFVSSMLAPSIFRFALTPHERDVAAAEMPVFEKILTNDGPRVSYAINPDVLRDRSLT